MNDIRYTGRAITLETKAEVNSIKITSISKKIAVGKTIKLKAIVELFEL